MQSSAGLNYKGLIPGREDDYTVLFVTYGHLSDKYGDSIDKIVDYEMVFELGYRIRLTPANFGHSRITPALEMLARFASVQGALYLR